MTRSDHSVDIVAASVSRLNAVRRLRETIGDAPILAIGDRGRWPGNDHELLREPFALGVDEISVDPATCWHLGESGQCGPPVTLLERDFPVAHVESLGYDLEASVPEQIDQPDLIHEWLEGEVYPQPRPALPM